MRKKETKQIVREIYISLKSGDFETYFSLLSDDIVYYAAGNCPVSGVHRGKDEIKKLGAITFRETKGTHRVKLKSLIANDTYAAVVDTWNATRNGKKIEMDNLLVYKVEDGKVIEIREFIEHEEEHDDFWK